MDFIKRGPAPPLGHPRQGETTAKYDRTAIDKNETIKYAATVVHTTGNLRYCSKHQHWYDARYGCQDCFLEQDAYRAKDNSSISLLICPACSKKSLAWFVLTNRYECMNSWCKKAFSREEYTSYIREQERLRQERLHQERLQQEEYESRIKEQERFQKEEPQEEQEHAENDSQPETIPEIQMVKCPICLKVSVAWSESNNRYECMNIKCKNTFSKESYETRITEWNRLLTEEPKGKAWFGNSYFDPKKKKWKKG